MTIFFTRGGSGGRVPHGRRFLWLWVKEMRLQRADWLAHTARVRSMIQTMAMAHASAETPGGMM